ncbi:MAG TPA: hypothetical protein VIW92_02345, partial [Thermoanaerobaculia bacterium]
LVVVHNNERDARDTAELMHQHCSYNLALVDSASTDRHIKIPPSGTKKDPNELFPRDVAEKCMKDDKACRDHLTSKSGATKESEILEYLKIQYFLTIKDCSAGFTLPVVAIHNNAINDTEKYLKEKKKLEAAAAKKGDPNPMDVFKEVDKPEGKHKKSDVEKLLKKKFQEQTVTDLVGTPGATNIYRWCKSKDLSRCHIGDPDHPDDVVWVTKPADFERLSKTNVNVALQTDLANAKGGESEKDLSTLFLVIEDILGAPHGEKAGRVTKEMVTDIAEAWDLITGLLIAAFSAAITSEKAWEDFLKAVAKLSGLSSKLDQLLKILGQAADELDKVRYINIETPHVTALNRPMSERVRNYETIVTVLSALGLHCCGKDEKETKKAEGDIKAKLNPPPAQSEKASPSTK